MEAVVLVCTSALLLVIVILAGHLWRVSSKDPNRKTDFWTLLAGGLVAFAVLGGQLASDLRLQDIAEKNDQIAQKESQLARERAQRESLQLEVGRQEDLSGIGLPGRDLSGFYLRGKNLTDANLEDAQLSDAILEHSTLVRADLSGADLQGSDLELADLRNAVLDGANLSNANLRGADLSFASLVGAKLEGANLFDANLVGSDLEETELAGANLVDASLERAVLEGSEVQDAEWSGATYDFLTNWPDGLTVNECSEFRTEPCTFPGDNKLMAFRSLIAKEVPTWIDRSPRDGIIFVAPGGRANLIGSQQPWTATGLEYAKKQGRLLEGKLPGYIELSFEPLTMLGGGFAYRRSYTWLPPKKAPGKAIVATQIQLYYVEAGRAYNLTATADGNSFAEFENAFDQVFDSLTG